MLSLYMLTIAGTGHRPDKLGGYSDEVFQALVDLADSSLVYFNPDIVISGMALGWDQALAQACINRKLKFVAAVPFRGQESKWPRESQEKYKEILSKAYETVFVSSLYDKGVMQKRNIWMVDQLEDEKDFLLALWDGSDGGTKNCIKYAERKQKKIVNLWEIYQNLI
jgi:uncharacterized phage-like protein YoqJ